MLIKVNNVAKLKKCKGLLFLNDKLDFKVNNTSTVDYALDELYKKLKGDSNGK